MRADLAGRMARLMTSPQRPLGLLQRVPVRARPGIFIGALVVVLLALFLPGAIGVALLALIIVALLALMGRTWMVTPSRMRALRVLILATVVAIAAYKLAH
jgi:hypothetical protein